MSRTEYISAASFVFRISRKYNVNKVWVWDLLESEFNIIKGNSGLVSLDERTAIEEIIKKEVGNG